MLKVGEAKREEASREFVCACVCGLLEERASFDPGAEPGEDFRLLLVLPVEEGGRVVVVLMSLSIFFILDHEEDDEGELEWLMRAVYVCFYIHVRVCVGLCVLLEAREVECLPCSAVCDTPIFLFFAPSPTIYRIMYTLVSHKTHRARKEYANVYMCPVDVCVVYGKCWVNDLMRGEGMCR